MTWDARQTAMLEAMGLRVWSAPAAVEPAAVAAVDVDDDADGATAVAAVPPTAPTAVKAIDALRVPVRPGTEARPAAAPVTVVPVDRSARAEAIARMDWTELRDSVAGCTACKLCEGRKNTVFGVGNERAQWMIVGEAPGQQEDLQGEPFVGQAGKLLDSMLRAIGLTRDEAPPESQVFIANTLKCRPPGNRNPEPDELVQCEPYLNRQIELIKPRIIVAMGRFAVQSLLRSSEPIGRLRGQVHRYQGVPLIVTYHPAYLLRNLPDKARAWEDLCLARATFEGTSER